jgi:hypothetical protein
VVMFNVVSCWFRSRCVATWVRDKLALIVFLAYRSLILVLFLLLLHFFFVLETCAL